MSGSTERPPPLMQRLYNRIWLLALIAIIVWATTYVLWGYVDIWTIPSG